MKKEKKNICKKSDNFDNELNTKIIDLCLWYQIEDSRLTINLIEHQIKFYELQKEHLLENKPFKFQKKKMKFFEDELNKIDNKIMKFYSEIEEELAIMEKMQNAINVKYETKIISFNDLLSLIEKRKNPKKIMLKLCNDYAIYEYSVDDHSYLLSSKEKEGATFNIYLNESLTDLEMIKKNIEIID